MKRCLILIVITFLFSSVVYASSTATPSIIVIDKNTTSTGIISAKSTVTSTIPENAVKIKKEDLIPFISQRFYWSSWTWINRGNYYGVCTIPEVFIDNYHCIINYPKNQFDTYLRNVTQLQEALYNRALVDLTEKILIKDEYYFTLDSDNKLYIYTDDGSGAFHMHVNNFQEN